MSILVLSLSIVLPLSDNSVYAHGPGPAGCSSYYDTPEYPAEITSFVVSNGEQSFDVLSNPESVIPVDVNEGYHVEFILHTYPYGFHRQSDGSFAYETSSNISGVVWYYDNTVGYGWGRCVEGVQGDGDKVISLDFPISEYYGSRTEGTHFIEFMASPYESLNSNEPLQSVGFYIWVQDESTPSEGQSTLTVSTVIVGESEVFEPLNGYYVELLKDSSVIDAQFSPASFLLNNGELYTVKPYDYGEYVFDYWADASASTTREKSIAISTNDGLTAVYRHVNESPTPPDEDDEDDDTTPAAQSAITVRTIDSGSDNEIYGYYTILYDDGGAVLDTGFSPATFDVTSGQTYTVEVQDYGSYYFNYWQDNGDTGRDRTITAADDETTLTAVYSTSPSATPPSDEEEEQPPAETSGEISVTTVDLSGNQLYGYYTTLSQNGNVIQTAFSPAEFTVNGGETYQVAVADYGQYVFDHWSDGSYDRFHDAEAGDELVAVYRP